MSHPPNTEAADDRTAEAAVSPTRRRLLALLAALPATGTTAAAKGSPARSESPAGSDALARLFAEFQATLSAHEDALRRCRRLEASLAAEVGFPRVRLSVLPGQPDRYAAETVTLAAEMPPGPHRDRLRRILHRRQARWDAAAEACGLTQAGDQETELFRAVRRAADTLYALPATTTTGVLLKLLVLLSLKEPGVAARDASPWRELRLILADLSLLTNGRGADL